MFQVKKTIQALSYFCRESNSSVKISTALAWLFLADVSHLREYGRTISEDTYIRTATGFEPVSTRDLLTRHIKAYVTTPDVVYCRLCLDVTPNDVDIRKGAIWDTDEMSDSDTQVLATTYSAYHRFSRSQLRAIVRTFPEWQAAHLKSVVSAELFLTGATDIAKIHFYLSLRFPSRLEIV